VLVYPEFCRRKLAATGLSNTTPSVALRAEHRCVAMVDYTTADCTGPSWHWAWILFNATDLKQSTDQQRRHRLIWKQKHNETDGNDNSREVREGVLESFAASQRSPASSRDVDSFISTRNCDSHTRRTTVVVMGDDSDQCSTKFMCWTSSTHHRPIAVNEQTQLYGMWVIRTIKPNVEVSNNINWHLTGGRTMQDGGQFIVKLLLRCLRTKSASVMTIAAKLTMTARASSSLKLNDVSSQ